MPAAGPEGSNEGVGECSERCALQVLGTGIALVGTSLVGVGVWARCDVGRALARERIDVALEPGAPSRTVTSAGQARTLAETIGERTVTAAGGRTYPETDEFLAADGSTTSDREAALVDERTGRPVTNPSHELWNQVDDAAVGAHAGIPRLPAR